MNSEALGWLSLVIGIIGYIPYFWTIFTGKTKPHTFTWFIWGLITAIAYFAQQIGGAGPGAWSTVLNAITAFLISFFALFKGEKQITRSDWFTFIAALLIIPVWYLTQNPLWAVILVVIIDLFGFYPTFRKSWYKPYEELAFCYTCGTFQFLIAMLALENFNWITALYPATIAITDAIFVAMILWRRKLPNRS